MSKIITITTTESDLDGVIYDTKTTLRCLRKIALLLVGADVPKKTSQLLIEAVEATTETKERLVRWK